MSGIVQLTQNVWGTSSVRIGTSSDFGNLDQDYRNADFATAVGLVICNKDAAQKNVRQKSKTRFSEDQKDSEGVGKKLSKLFKNFF